MKRILVLVLAAFLPHMALAQCMCPPSGVGGAPERPIASIVSTDGASVVFICGYLDKQISPVELEASEFDVIDCKSAKKLLTFDALQTCHILIRHGNKMTITLVERLPLGPQFEWIDVPHMEYQIKARANAKHVKKQRYILKVRRFSPEEIHSVLAEYADAVRQIETPGLKPWQNKEAADHWFNFIESLLGKLAVVAMSGNVEATKTFKECPDTLQLGGHLSEEYDQLKELWQEHTKHRQA